MITSKVFWKDEECIFFDKGNGVWTFYRKSNVPDYTPWKILDEPTDDMLRQIAIKSGLNVVKQYYVTPPDRLESWMGTYTFLPSGMHIHCDPVAYGSEDPYDPSNDMSEATSNFIVKHKDKIFDNKKNKTPIQ